MIKRALFIVFLILVFSAPAFAQTNQSISLKEGFNFVSFTVNPSLTPSQLKASYPLINDIYFYSAAAGSFLSLNAGELTTISAGRGYIIKSTATGSVNVPGTAVSSVNIITLKTGFNLVGFSKMPETVTFAQLMQRASNIKGLYKWNAAAGTFLAVIRNGSTIEQIDGVDPVMKSAESYFFNMLEDTTLDYNGTTIAVGGGSSNRVATPVFSPAGGVYTSSQSVVISCATSGAAIRYTTDGTTPSASSQLYISSISVSQTMTISAIAIKAGLDNSYVSSATYTFGQTQAPAITSVVGTSVDNGNDTVKITFNTSMNKTAVEMSSNWTVKYDDDKVSGGETVLSLTATPFFYDSNNLTLTVTLKKVENSAYLPNGKYVQVIPTASVKSSAGTSVNAAPFYSAAAVTGDLNAPNPLAEADKSKLSFSNAGNKVSIVSTTLTTNREAAILEVYTGSSQPTSATLPSKRSVIKASNGFFAGDIVTGVSSASAGHGVWYRFCDGAGNKSGWVQDGIIPPDPIVTTVSLNNQTGAILVGGTPIISLASFDSIQVYYDDNGSGAGLTLHNYTGFMAVNGANTSYSATSKGAWTAIADGKLVSYAIKNSDDNISTRKYDTSNPPAVVIPERIYISAYDKKINYSANLNGGVNTGLILYMKVTRGGSVTVYKYNTAFANNEAGALNFSAGSASNQFTHVSGDIITATFPRAGDEISYALEAASKLSTYVSDGSIPAAPDASKLGYYAAASPIYQTGGFVSAAAGSVTNTSTLAKLSCYQATDAQGTSLTLKGVNTGRDLTTAFDFQAADNGGVISSEKYVLYTLTNENGNISLFTVDGIVPPAPALPAAQTLVAAGDGGQYALAGFVNDHGSHAVKMRPGISLVSGESLSLRAIINSTGILMTARASLSALPVFGEQTPNVIYVAGAADDGDQTTGTLNFTKLEAGTVAVNGSLININGNASAWSQPVSVQYEANAVPPRITIANCYAVDTEKDGKLNSLVLDFDKNIKINGTLNTAAGASNFHNGVTVNNGSADAALNVTGYSINTGTGTDKLIITFDNSIAGTGLVKINIVNANSTNFLSDLYGNKLVAINLSGSDAATNKIPDLVAPTHLKILPANLSFNNATGKVNLLTAAIDCWENAKLEVYFGSSPDASTAAAAFKAAAAQHSVGELISGIASQNIVGVHYRLVDDAAVPNKSAWVSDGTVAVSPDFSKITYSAYETANHVGVQSGAVSNTSTSSKLICYQSDNNAGLNLVEKGSITGINLSGAFSFTANNGGSVIAADKYVIYSLVNENGNYSAYALDGQIPATPALPAADVLIADGDGGLNAKGGFVNDAGKLAVTMRPGITVANGESVIIKAVKTNSIKMTAKVSADNTTPIFGATTANSVYTCGSATDGNQTTGSFNFSSISTGEVSVYASKTNTSGNSSAWSSAAKVLYDTGVMAPKISIDGCYAVDDDKDGNINFLILKFDRGIKINGTLSAAAGTGNFHNGITVFDGASDLSLVVNNGGYSVQNDNELKITFDNNVKGSGVVKANIVNASAVNFLSDLYGNKLVAVNLDASVSTHTIADKVAPSSSANIVQNNLFFSNASGKVDLKTADIECGETAKLEIYFGNNPGESTQASASSASAAVHYTGNPITGIPSKSSGSRVWYRLIDDAGNKSDWVEDSTIPAPPNTSNLAWSDAASNVTISNTAVALNTELLRIYRKNSSTYTYLGRTTAVDHSDKLGPYASGSSYAAETAANATIKVRLIETDFVAYTLFNTAGNESAYANDTSSPPDKPIAEKLHVSAEDKAINCQASLNNSTNSSLKLYLKITRGINVATYKANSAFTGDSAVKLTFPGDFTQVSTIALVDFPKVGDAVEYALENSAGLLSAYTADGVIPTAPLSSSKFYYNASLDKVVHDTLINGSNNSDYKIYIEASKNTDRVTFVSGATLNDAAPEISLSSFVRTVTGSETNVYDSALKAGVYVNYGLINVNGNTSTLISDGFVPAAPDAAKLAYSSAVGKAYADAGVTSDTSTIVILSCYQADNLAGTTNRLLKGSITGINLNAANANFTATSNGGVIPAAKYAIYTITDTNGNISAFTADGTIPELPDKTKLFYASNETVNQVVANSGITTNTSISSKLTCYQSTDATGTIISEKGSVTGINLSNAFTFTANSGGVITTGSYVLYTLTNEDKNVSAYQADGQIPAPPALPVATALVTAGDGGAFASAGYVNSNGKLAVKVRPGLQLASIGEAISVKIADKAATPNSIKMTAAALAINVTPAFGLSTANVSYYGGTLTDGDPATGSFNFTPLTTQGLTINAALINTSGNTSYWSSPAVDILYDIVNAAPLVKPADSYATDDDKDGKLNTLVLQFDKAIKINGALNVAAGAGEFHNGVSVNNGTIDSPLVVSAYAVTGDNNDKLQITFDDNVAGTGLVKINIVNFHASNFVSDLYGHKLAAINFNAADSATTIPDKVAPSSSKITAANLFFNNAIGTAELKTAAINCGEKAKLEIYFGSDPIENTPATVFKAAAVEHAIGALITGVAPQDSKSIHYRLVDESDNKSTWVADGYVPEPPTAANLTWSDETSKFSVSNQAVANTDTILRIYRQNSSAYTYLGRAVNDGLNTDKKGAYNAGTQHDAKKADGNSVKVYIVPDDHVAYTLYHDAAGNESGYAVDSNVAPAAPNASALFVNAHEKTINCSASLNGSTNSSLRLCVKITRDLTTETWKATNLFANNSAITFTFPGDFTQGTNVLTDFPKAGDAVEFALESSTGQTSSFVSDGTIPAAPLSSAKFTYNAGTNQVNYQSDINGGDNTAYKLYVYTVLSGDKVYFHSNSSLSAGPAVVSLSEFARTAVPLANEANVYTSKPSLAAGVSLYYALIDTTNGNISAAVACGTVPAVPDKTKLAYSAATGTVVFTAGVTTKTATTVILKCYQADNTAGGGLSAEKGSKTGINFNTTGSSFTANTGGVIAADKYAIYTIIDENGNVSDYGNDGTIPVKPDASKLAYSAINGKVTVTAGVTVNPSTGVIISCYQADSVAGGGISALKGSKTGVNFTLNDDSFTANTGGVIEPDKYIIYTLTDDNGNASIYCDDGTLPQAPQAAALADLAIRRGSTAKYEVLRVDATAAGDILPAMDILLTLDGGTTLTKCGSTSGASAYTKVADIGNANTLVEAMTPKYAYKNSTGNISAVSAADGAIRSLSSVHLNQASGLFTFTFSAAIDGIPAQADFDSSKAGVISLAANSVGNAAGTAVQFGANWTVTGDNNTQNRFLAIKDNAVRSLSTDGQIMVFGDGSAGGGKTFNLSTSGTANLIDSAGGNLLVSNTDRLVTFEAIEAPLFSVVKGETAAGVFSPIANGTNIINNGKFHLEFNKPVIVKLSNLHLDTTTPAWAAGTPPVFSGATLLANNLKTFVLTNTVQPGTVSTSDKVKVVKEYVKDLSGKAAAADYEFTVVLDSTAPVLDNISVQSVASENNVVRLSFTKSVWWGTSLTSTHITATVGGAARTVTSVDARLEGAAATTLDITIQGSPLTDGQAVSVTITAAGAAAIKDNTSSKNPMASTVTKSTNYAADKVAPTFDSITLQSIGQNNNIVRMTFSEPVWWASSLVASDITVTVGGSARNITSIPARAKTSAASTQDLTIDGVPVTNSQVIIVTITLSGAGKIKDNSYSENVMSGTANKSVTAIISTAPTPSHFAANAKTNVVTIIGSTANAIAKVFVNGTYRQSITLNASGAGSADVIGTVLAAGNAMAYTLTDGTKVESDIINDGIIAYATVSGLNGADSLADVMQASGITDKVKSVSAIGAGGYLIINNANLVRYLSDGEISVNNWVTPKTSKGGVAGVLEAGAISYQFENTNGNLSPAVNDGTIPAAPESTKVYVDAEGKIHWSGGTVASQPFYTAFYNGSLNEDTGKMISGSLSDASVAVMALLEAPNSSAIGKTIQWVTKESASGNFSEGSPIETLVGVAEQASVYMNQVKLANGVHADVFTASTDGLDYIKILFTGPIAVAANTNLSQISITGPASLLLPENTILSVVVGKTSSTVNKVLKIANKGASCTLALTAGTTKLNLNAATIVIRDAHGNAVFPATLGPVVTGTTAQNETDD